MGSRREFMTTAAAVLSGLGLLSQPLLASKALVVAETVAKLPKSTPRVEAFAAAAGSEFTVHDPSGQVRLTLHTVTAGAQAAEFNSFSLLFKGHPAQHLADDIYRVSHPRLGELEVFLSQIHRPGVTQSYEAVFSSRKVAV